MKKLLLPLVLLAPVLLHAAPDQPNILWIVQEDTSPWMGCYGHEANATATPNIDRLAEEGVLFTRAYTPAPVCSSCRSSFIVGCNAIRFGGHAHRSRRGAAGKPLQAPYTTLPELLQKAGYFTFNQGKSDYNFIEEGRNMYGRLDKSKGRPWRSAPAGQPFWGQIQIQGGKTNTRNLPADKKTDPATVTVPADYPQHDLYREVVAQHCDTIRSDDLVIARILADLEADGLTDTTIVVYFSDHGANNLVRHKQMPTEAGLHVPCIFKGPAQWVPRGQVRNDLVSILDLTATTLGWAGVARPAYMEGRDLLAKDFQPRTFVAAAKDRLDHTIDRVRTVRTERFRYTRNYLLDRVLLQPQYRDGKDYLKYLRQAYADGTLDPKLAQIYFGERPAEELYDITKDPAQVNNLAGDPAFAGVLQEHRQILDAWLAKGDEGAGPEPDIELEQNGWAKWGRGVNPEYERIRNDTDGDGLSDEWETVNGRDPQDGKLLFTFDCGGWQTEGWAGSGTDNIAGMQGCLDFVMEGTTATLTRGGLNLDADKNPGRLALWMKCSNPVTVSAATGGVDLGAMPLAAGEDYQLVALPLGPAWTGIVHDLKLDIVSARPGAQVAIDWIKTAP